MNHEIVILYELQKEYEKRKEEEKAEALRNAIRDLNAYEKEKNMSFPINVIRSDELRCEINKSINNGDDFGKIIDLCLKCISSMTLDERFYKNNKRKLKIREDRK